MCKGVFMRALYDMLQRVPTDEEKRLFLDSMARQAGGDRIYIAHRQMTADEAGPEIRRLHLEGWSVRRIAGAVGWQKSRVAEVLRVHNSALKVDS